MNAVNTAKLQFAAVSGVPEIRRGDDLGALAADALRTGSGDLGPPRDGDIIVIAQKAVSKAEGRRVLIGELTPGDHAVELAAATDKDPRLVQAILDESERVVRAKPGVLIVETHHGFICANAGIDRSNVPGDDSLLLLPIDPDESARKLRLSLQDDFGAMLGVIVTDSFGRAWRVGQQDVAIGCAGVRPVVDLRGEVDNHGRELSATLEPVADVIAAAADLARGKSSREPIVVVRGRADLVTAEDGPGAVELLRESTLDLFK